jgi:hypothetical protein
MQQQTAHKMGKQSLAYLDPQIAMRTNIDTNRQEDVAYFAKTMRHCRDKMLVVPFNMNKHCITLSISTKYDQV